MKRKNMPNRKNLRRIKALTRLESLPKREDRVKLIKILKSRIIPENEALKIQTKIDRRSTARFGR